MIKGEDVMHQNPLVMVSRGYNNTPSYKPPERKLNINKNVPNQECRQGCTYCGGYKHTKENCFKLVGYPDWWKERKHRQQEAKRGKAYAAVATQEKIVESAEPLEQKGGSNLTLQNATTNSVTAMRYAESMREEPSSGSSGKIYTEGIKSISKLDFALLAENIRDDREVHKWVIDSGATDHMTLSEKDISKIMKPSKNGIINANGETYPVKGMGNVPISKNLTLNNALLVPSLSTRLISVGKITEDLNCAVIMFPNFCIFQDILTREIIGSGSKREGLYYLDSSSFGMACSARSNLMESRNKVWLWHKRLGHPSFGYMRKLSPSLFLSLENEDFTCETCIKAKSHRTSYHSSNSKSINPFDLIHTDVWGPAPVISKSGYRWFVLFTDDCTRMTWLYLLKNKDEVPNVFQIFFKMVKTQFEKDIKMVRSDNGREYINQNLQIFFSEKGIIHETSCVRTPQ
jgi:GAG-pre-integrase domain/Integrase core domain